MITRKKRYSSQCNLILFTPTCPYLSYKYKINNIIHTLLTHWGKRNWPPKIQNQTVISGCGYIRTRTIAMSQPPSPGLLDTSQHIFLQSANHAHTVAHNSVTAQSIGGDGTVVVSPPLPHKIYIIRRAWAHRVTQNATIPDKNKSHEICKRRILEYKQNTK